MVVILKENRDIAFCFIIIIQCYCPHESDRKVTKHFRTYIEIELNRYKGEIRNLSRL